MNRCCFVDDSFEEARACKAEAVWRILSSPFRPGDSMDSCAEHVGALLPDVEEHRIIRIPPAREPGIEEPL